MWRGVAGAGLVVAGIVALVEDHAHRPEYGCARSLNACERGEGLYPLTGHLTETSYNVLGGVGWALATLGAALIVITLIGVARASKNHAA
jgi:hypothetical protein